MLAVVTERLRLVVRAREARRIACRCRRNRWNVSRTVCGTTTAGSWARSPGPPSMEKSVRSIRRMISELTRARRGVPDEGATLERQNGALLAGRITSG